MKAPVKSTIIIVVTLLIGIAIGFQISEMTLKNHFKKMSEFRKPEGFVRFFEDVIKPDEKQKKIIEPIILKYHQLTDSVAKSSFRNLGMLLDSLKQELKPELSVEQNKNLEIKFNEMKNMGRRQGEKEDGHKTLLKVDSTKEGTKTDTNR
jgi:hypothetical protein